jgi:hypothetical protein
MREKFNQEKEIVNSEKHFFGKIKACILSEENLIENKNEITLIKERGFNLDWDFEEDDYLEHGIKSSGPGTYLISGVDNFDKFSLDYGDCIGAIVVGRNKEGKNVSLMTHQKPENFINKNKEVFLKDLNERLDVFINNIDGDIDVIIFGGNKGGGDYEESIKLMGSALKKKTSVAPSVITGPNLSASMTDVFFDNTNRRLYLARGEQDSHTLNEDYLADEIGVQKKKWFQ